MGINVRGFHLTVPRTFIPTNLIPHACMLPKGCYSAKIKSAKTFLKVFPRKFIPMKIIRYTVLSECSSWRCANASRHVMLHSKSIRMIIIEEVITMLWNIDVCICNCSTTSRIGSAFVAVLSILHVFSLMFKLLYLCRERSDQETGWTDSIFSY